MEDSTDICEIFDSVEHNEDVYVKKSEKLGSFISHQDLCNILSGPRKAQILNSYFSNTVDQRSQRALEFVELLANCFYEDLPSRIVEDTVEVFDMVLHKLINIEGENKYLTRSKIALYFTALLDYRLNLVGSKISVNHFSRIQCLPQVGKKCNLFNMKKIQQELINNGIIEKKRKRVYIPLLLSKVSTIINHLISLYPKEVVFLRKLENKAKWLISRNLMPRTDTLRASFSIIGVLLKVNAPQSDISKTFWEIVKDVYKLDRIIQRRTTYRYTVYLKEKKVFTSLKISSKSDDGEVFV